MLAVFGISECRNVYSQNIDDITLGRVLGIKEHWQSKGELTGKPRILRWMKGN